MEITKVDKHLKFEINILSRDYSQMREANSKWIYFQQAVSQPSGGTYTVSSSDDPFLTIYKPNQEVSNSFQIPSLYKRLNLKRHFSLLNSINSFWSLMNPFHLRGISKEVYIKIHEFLYFNVLNRVNDSSSARQHAEKDAAVDFEDRNYIVFCDFYDSLFELLDSSTRSFLVSEYVRLVRSFEKLVRGASWFSAMNLHNKLHLKEDDLSRVSVKPWMSKLMSSPEKEDRLPELLRDNSRSHISFNPAPSHLTERFYHSRKKSMNDNVQLQMKKFTLLDIRTSHSKTLTRTLSRAQSYRKINTQRSLSKETRFPSNERQKSIHLHKVGPLSISHSKLVQKPKDLLERIIEGRKTFISNMIEANQPQD